MALDKAVVLGQIDAALAKHTQLRSQSQYSDCSDQPLSAGKAVEISLASAIHRLAPPSSIFRSRLEELLAERGNPFSKLEPLVGLLTTLREEYDAGYFGSLTELVHAETFASFMDMAEHLLDQGYKDPAAVIAGSVLEQHLRELAVKNGLQVEAGGKPRKADAINADLAAADVFSKLDQKNVTAWLGLRNEAAHGNYSKYSDQQVSLMIQSISDFMSRHPA
jgi:hypothetical protein